MTLPAEHMNFHTSGVHPPGSHEVPQLEVIYGSTEPFFNQDYYTDAQIAEVMDQIPGVLFTLKTNTEIEVLSLVFDQLGLTPTVDEIEQTRETDEAFSLRLGQARAMAHEMLRLAINTYHKHYFRGGERDIDAIDDLYGVTDAWAHTNTVIRAIEYLKTKHADPVLFNAEASLRIMADPRT